MQQITISDRLLEEKIRKHTAAVERLGFWFKAAWAGRDEWARQPLDRDEIDIALNALADATDDLVPLSSLLKSVPVIDESKDEVLRITAVCDEPLLH